MPNVMFVLTQHGGHMGFFEGAVLLPHALTWMDKVIVEYVDAICRWEEPRPGRELLAAEKPHGRRVNAAPRRRRKRRVDVEDD